ncbi:hypothetical protein SLEP1_g386 [Rubroshorea leprosula]|uniref:Uncharacterized protein n=1 Tax=Rubroshorea leprosula TaxID=152421 RepID=A0AAV5HAH8_9ROSI|nr:hypothetical protein SLEP1_g386 [Rubroshorea leprosula]
MCALNWLVEACVVVCVEGKMASTCVVASASPPPQLPLACVQGGVGVSSLPCPLVVYQMGVCVSHPLRLPLPACVLGGVEASSLPYPLVVCQMGVCMSPPHQLPLQACVLDGVEVSSFLLVAFRMGVGLPPLLACGHGVEASHPYPLVVYQMGVCVNPLPRLPRPTCVLGGVGASFLPFPLVVFQMGFYVHPSQPPPLQAYVQGGAACAHVQASLPCPLMAHACTNPQQHFPLPTTACGEACAHEVAPLPYL